MQTVLCPSFQTKVNNMPICTVFYLINSKVLVCKSRVNGTELKLFLARHNDLSTNELEGLSMISVCQLSRQSRFSFHLEIIRYKNIYRENALP